MRFRDDAPVIHLYKAGGATDFTMLQAGLHPDRCQVLLANTTRLLTARNQSTAAEILRSTPFRIVEATNHFNDDFSILHAVVSLSDYERLRNSQPDPAQQEAFRQIAGALNELGTYIRFVAVDLALESPPPSNTLSGAGLKKSEINILVNKYIGVSGGYLGDFSYRTHYEFYIELDLEIDPGEYHGTTRERFITILTEASPEVQARILDGVLERFAVGSSPLRSPERAAQIRGWAKRLRSEPQIEQPTLRITSDVVERALRDAQELLRTSGAPSGVDRVHTALHGHVQEICRNAALPVEEDASLSTLFKQLRDCHPAFRNLGPRGDDILRVLRALGTILDSLSPLRNRASVAHPNTSLLPEAEAVLVINVGRSILHYLDEKVCANASGGA